MLRSAERRSIDVVRALNLRIAEIKCFTPVTRDPSAPAADGTHRHPDQIHADLVRRHHPRGFVTWLPSHRVRPGTANMKFAMSDNLDRVLVLSYTEFVQQPVRDDGGGIKDGCTGEDD